MDLSNLMLLAETAVAESEPSSTAQKQKRSPITRASKRRPKTKLVSELYAQ